MSNHTKIFSNDAVASMRSMAWQLIDALKWRHHGIGALQGYLSEGARPEIRMHVWSRLLLKPGMDVSGDIHDHRFAMVSHVLHGVVAHEEVKPTAQDGGAYRMLALTHARAAADNKFHGPTEELPGTFDASRKSFRILRGQSYTFDAGIFHRSPLDATDGVAVSIVEKHDQRDDMRARILYPASVPPVMAFGHDADETLTREVLRRAKLALMGA